MSLSAYIDANAKMANHSPTEAQKAAGNYAKGHVKIHGLNIAIENPRGSKRSGTDGDGKPWSVTMQNHYGYIKGTTGADGDHIDSYIGPHVKAPNIYVVDQLDADSGKFDEHKAFIGFASKQQVERAYRNAFSDGKADDRMGKIHEMSVDKFKDWLRNGDQSRPLKRASGGRVLMAAGGAAPGDELEDAPWANKDSLPDAPWAISGSSAEAPDHGLSERQKLSPLGKAVSPITSYPETYSRMNKEAREQVSHGAGQMAAPEGAWDFAKGAGNVALGSLGYLTSPINAAYRSVVGQPLEDVTGVPREYSEFAAQLATPGIGLPRIGEVPTATPRVPQPSAASQNEIVAAANRVSDVAPAPIEVPRAFASDNMAVQRAGQLARTVPIVGDSIPRATGAMVDQLGDATKSIGSAYGEGSGPNVANRIGRTLQESADAEARSSSGVAQRSDEALTNAWQDANDAAYNAVVAHEANSLERARNAIGDLSPQDMGETLISRLRAGEQEARATKDRLYQIAGNSDAAINSDAIGSIHSRVAQSLENDGRVIDGVLTPASSRMLDELQKFSTLNVENRAVGARPPLPAGEVPPRAAVSVQGIEQTRKKLGAIAQSAANDGDRSAAKKIIREFDSWESDAFDNALFSGSPEALASYRQARDANRNWRTKFGYNERDDADRILNRIATGEVTPQEVSNWIVGASQVGSKGSSSRLLTRLTEATDGDPEALQAIRGGVWNRLSGTTEGVAPRAPAKVSSDIKEFLNGSGRDMANRLFTPQQRDIASAYADTLRRGITARENLTDAARNTKPQALEVGIGPMQELAKSVLGKSGKSDEALFSAIDAYARSGARGDVKTLSSILKAVPEMDRGDLAGAIIRNLGNSKGGFSPDIFASEWTKYSPQAKALLFGNAGPHRQALDDIAKISQRYKDVGRRFGNPSGTAQNVAGLGVLGSLFAAPITTIAGLLGGTVAAKVLSSPVAAHKAATWSKTVDALSRSRTPQKVLAFEAASRNLANAAKGFGSNVSPVDFIRSIQGPIPSRADDKQQ